MDDVVSSISDRRKIYRLMDANVNRAREGLRVLEDVARFIFNDEAVTKRVRTQRHTLDRIFRTMYPSLIEARESKKDMGRTFSEGTREDLSDLIKANCKRVEEALRVLEEFAKILAPKQASEFKALRYRAYQIEKDFSKRDPALPTSRRSGLKGRAG